MQNENKIQRKLLFLIILQIPIFVIVALLPYDANAQTLHNQTLEEKVREMGTLKDNPQISVSDSPTNIEILNNRHKQEIFVADSNTISVIDLEYNRKIAEIPIAAPGEMAATSDRLFVANSKNISVISTEDNNKIAEIPVGERIGDIIFNFFNYKMYVAHPDSNTISVISTEDNNKIAEIPVGERPDYGVAAGNMAFDYRRLYLTHPDSNTISVIDLEYNRKIAEIPVGDDPTEIDINHATNTIYVANSDSNTISVISTKNNTKIAEIPVGDDPTDIDINHATNTIYVANYNSVGISVIDGETNQVVAGVKFNIYPPNSGYIKCNNLDYPLNEFLYVSSECTAKANKGFEFISWVENLGSNSNRTVKTSAENNYILESFYDIFGYKPDDPAASLFQFGNYTANFKALPPPISSEYLIPLYGIIITTIVGWSIPSIINWIRTKKDIKKLNYYHKEIISIYNDGKLDEKDLDHLNRLKNCISNDYSKGKLNERHYENLQNEISISYDEIFKKRIDSIINDSSTNKEDKKKQLNKINEDIEDAYSKSRINELHYKLLKEKIKSKNNGSLIS